MSDAYEWAIHLSDNVGAVCVNGLRHSCLDGMRLLCLLLLMLLLCFRSLCGDGALLSQMRLIVLGQVSLLPEAFATK